MSQSRPWFHHLVTLARLSFPPDFLLYSKQQAKPRLSEEQADLALIFS